MHLAARRTRWRNAAAPRRSSETRDRRSARSRTRGRVAALRPTRATSRPGTIGLKRRRWKSRTPCPAAARIHLDRRAFYGAVGTEHATVAAPRTQHSCTALAVIEEDAGIGRHGFDCDVSALGTFDLGDQLDGRAHGLNTARKACSAAGW